MELVCEGFHQGAITTMDVALQRPIIITTSSADNISVYSNIIKVSSSTNVTNSSGYYYHYNNGEDGFPPINTTTCFEPYSAYLRNTSDSTIEF